MNRRVFCCLIIGLAVLAAGPAAAVDIAFNVRMGQQMTLGLFDPAQDSVDVAGTFNGWGGSPLTPLADADGDSIYTVVVGGFTPGETIEYKFRLNGAWDGTEEFPGVGSNRVYTVQPSGNIIDVWYNGMEPRSGPVHWWNDTVFYELMVRSFHDSDGDGIGDLQGLIQKLDYLNDGDPGTDDDLGITGIWLMPINDAASYHGYDATDYRAIDPEYGTMADFQAFLAAAHARGIKVIVDYVMNHCSDEHPWFAAAEQNDPTYRDWFRWETSDPGGTGPWGQNVWHWNSSGWYYGLFWDGMPDLNYDNPAVESYMFDTATYWLDTVGVDGFRLDAVLYIDEDGGQLQSTPETLQFWQDFNAHVKSVDADALSVGEAWTDTPTVVQYVEDDRLDLCFEFDLAYATMDAVNGGDAAYLGSKAAQVYGQYPYLQFATFLTNHDQDRSFTRFGEDPGKARVAAGIYLTLPGVPFLYYGEEIGMTGSGDHLFIRSPMQWDGTLMAGFTTGTPWQAVNTNHVTFNVADQTGDPASLLSWYRDLIHVRNASPALRRGSYAAVGASDTAVLAHVRRDSLQTVLCLANTSAGDRTGLTLSLSAAGLAAGDYQLVDLLDPADAPVMTVAPDLTVSGVDLDGHEVKVYEVIAVTAVEDRPGDLPATGLRLEPVHPNPFNPSTLIRYTLAQPSRVRIGVYDVAGREVVVLLDGHQGAGARSLTWDGTDADGRTAGAGVYVLRVETDTAVRQEKMTLLK